jgi:hypothetical protein
MRTLFPAAALISAMLALPVYAATPPAPATPPAAAAAVKLKPYVTKGFRSAQFGQDQAQVIAAIEKDFGVKPADVQHMTVPSDGTSALVIIQSQMAPAPGTVTITYVLGKNGNLIHVNVVWQISGEANGVQRAQMVQSGLTLTSYFQSYSWDASKSLLNVPTGPNSVTMFMGRDNQGGTVQVAAAGVSFQHLQNGKSVSSPTPSGPVRLEVSYGSANEGSDIATIKAGQF